MSHPSKAKGNSFERELVADLEVQGFPAERAWGSNGAAMGEHPEVDVRFQGGGRKWTVQAKRRKSIPAYLKPTDTDIVVVRADRDISYAVVPLSLLLELIKNAG